MKNFILLCLSVTLFSSVSFAAAEDIVATYKGGKVTKQDVMAEFQQMLESNPDTKGKKFNDLNANIQEMLVKNYVTQFLLLEESKRRKITESAEFKKKVELAKQQIVSQLLIYNHVNQVVTEQAIKKAYNEHIKSIKGKKEVKTRHILFASEEEAKKAKDTLNASKDKNKTFLDLVTKFSKDPGSKQNKGEIGYVMRGHLAPEYESKAFAMKKNEISAPIKTKFGWHIIQVLDQRTVKIPTAAEVEKSISNKLSNEAVAKYLKDLEKKAEVKITLK